MSILFSTFSFFKAGQGAFYGGRIWDRNNKKYTTIVYDCGTSPFISGHTKSLNHEIDDFKSHMPDHRCENPTEVIDILFISHLDYDHISGIKRLITEFDVKRIVMPYIPQQIRSLFVFTYEVDSVLNGDIEQDGLLSLEDYSQLLDDPVEFINLNTKNFEGKNPEIYIIKGGESKFGYTEPSNDSNDGIIIHGTIINDPLDFSTAPNTSYYENNFQAFLNSYWEFTTYVQEFDENKIKLFRNTLNNLLPERSTDLKEFFKDDGLRKKARKCYLDHFTDINSHGLVLLHGPINFERLYTGHCVNCEWYSCHRHCRRHHRHNNKGKLFTLLLGDTSLNADNNPLYFPTQFLEKIKYVHVIQIPHHGSSKNWNRKNFSNLEVGINLGDLHLNNEIISVCNYGVGNRYHHPAPEVVNEIEVPLILNNQFTRFTICYEGVYSY